MICETKDKRREALVMARNEADKKWRKIDKAEWEARMVWYEADKALLAYDRKHEQEQAK